MEPVTVIFLLLFIWAVCATAAKIPDKPVQQNETFEYNYETLKLATYLKSLKGDKAARIWCEQNIFSSGVVESTTSQAIINDAIQGLVATGFKKIDARKLVLSLVKDKQFTTPQQLIMACFQKKT